MIDEINRTVTGNDFIELVSRGFEIISEHRKYRGFSFQIIGKIKNNMTPFSIDIGVGDIVFRGLKDEACLCNYQNLSHQK